jgi:hypothetical protein
MPISLPLLKSWFQKSFSAAFSVLTHSAARIVVHFDSAFQATIDILGGQAWN